MVVEKLNSEARANLLNPEVIFVGAQIQILAKQGLKCRRRFVKATLFAPGKLPFGGAAIVRAALRRAAGRALLGSRDIRNAGFGVGAAFFVGVGEEFPLGILGVVFLHVA